MTWSCMVHASWEYRDEVHMVFPSRTLNLTVYIKTQYPHKQFNNKVIKIVLHVVIKK